MKKSFDDDEFGYELSWWTEGMFAVTVRSKFTIDERLLRLAFEAVLKEARSSQRR